MIDCPKCGTKNKNNDKECKECKLNLEEIFICPTCRKTFLTQDKICDDDKLLPMDIKEYKKIKRFLNKGNKLSENKEYEEAIKEYEKGLKKSENAEILLSKIYSNYMDLNEIEKASEYLEKIIEINPNNKLVEKDITIEKNEEVPNQDNIENIKKQIITELENNNLYNWNDKNTNKIKSLNNLDEILEFINTEFEKTIDSDNEETLFSKASFFESEKSLIYLDKIIENDSENLDAIYKKISIEIGLNKTEDALETINKIPEDNANHFYYKGHVYKQTDEDKALDNFLKSLEINSEHKLAISYVADILENQNKLEEALEYTDKYLKLDSTNEYMISKKINLLNDLGRTDEVDKLEREIEENKKQSNNNLIDEYTKLIKKDPNNKELILIKGMTLTDLGRFDEAIKCFEEGLKKSPDYVNFIYGKANAINEKGNSKKALKIIKKAIKQNSSEPMFYDLKANILLKLGRYKKAIEEYDNALNLKPDLINAKIGKMNSYALLKEYKEALTITNEMLEQDPNNESIKAMKTRLEEIIKEQNV